MAATPTTNLGLSKPAEGDNGWAGLLNANWDLIDGLAGTVGQFAVRAADIDGSTGHPTSLRYTIAAGTAEREDGSTVAIPARPSPGGSLSVPAGATTCVWLDPSGDVFTGTAFPATGTYMPLAAITADSSKITPGGIVDKRGPARFLRGRPAVYLPNGASTIDYAVTSEDGLVVIDAAAAGVTVTLPAGSSGMDGRVVVVLKYDASANAVTIDGNGKLINGAGTYTLSAQYQRVSLLYSATTLVSGWLVIGT